jgi:hypothetical protein
MSNTGDQTWQERLLREQQQTNENLSAVTVKQHNIIRLLMQKLHENGINESLQSYEAQILQASSEKASFHLGPLSQPITWTGGKSDLVPVLIDGKEVKAQIWSDDIIVLWNQFFNLRKKIAKYQKEFEFEGKLSDEWFQKHEEMVAEAKAGHGFNEEYDARWKKWYDASQTRMDDVEEKLKLFRAEEKRIHRQLLRQGRGVLEKSSSRLRDHFQWLGDLRDSKVRKYEDEYEASFVPFDWSVTSDLSDVEDDEASRGSSSMQNGGGAK